MPHGRHPLTGPYLPTLTHAYELLDDLASGRRTLLQRCLHLLPGLVARPHGVHGRRGAPAAAIDWAWCVAANDPSVLAMVVLSVEERLGVIAEAELAWFCDAAGELATDGIELTDWVHRRRRVLVDRPVARSRPTEAGR
ncbi:MAG: hypothetical protein R2699_13300 [Acidimicrobiales bacterium]